MTLVKFCGVTNKDDALLATSLGAHYLGFNFFERSPRFLSAEAAQVCTRVLPKKIERVGIFVDASEEYVERCARIASLDLLQFHGNETPEYCARWKSWKVIKAIRMSAPEALEQVRHYEGSVDYFLFDSFDANEIGGTGKLIAEQSLEALQISGLLQRSFLAGGLTPENVTSIVKRFKPFAVDVSSGIESAPGKKDPMKMKHFLGAVAARTLPFSSRLS